MPRMNVDSCRSVAAPAAPRLDRTCPTPAPRRAAPPGAARGRSLLLLAVVVLGLGAAGCASSPDDRSGREKFNRSMFAVNMGIDGKIQRPLASISQGTSTPFLRQRAINFFDNLSQPHTIANDLLQGRFKRAATDATRLVVNSTFGLAGLFDPAEETLGLRRIEQHFGITAGVWGLPEGPYFMLPVLGPTHARGLPDTPMRVVTNPIWYVDASLIAKASMGFINASSRAVDRRKQMDRVREAISPYAFVRSGWEQRRRAQVREARADSLWWKLFGPDDFDADVEPGVDADGAAVESEAGPFEPLPDDVFEPLPPDVDGDGEHGAEPGVGPRDPDFEPAPPGLFEPLPEDVLTDPAP